MTGNYEFWDIYREPIGTKGHVSSMKHRARHWYDPSHISSSPLEFWVRWHQWQVLSRVPDNRSHNYRCTLLRLWIFAFIVVTCYDTIVNGLFARSDQMTKWTRSRPPSSPPRYPLPPPAPPIRLPLLPPGPSAITAATTATAAWMGTVAVAMNRYHLRLGTSPKDEASG